MSFFRLIRWLYKKLILLTHPDKTDDLENNDFNIIFDAYQSGNIWVLLKYAEKYKLFSQSDLNINDIVVLVEKTLYDIELKIKQMKSSSVYMVMVESKLNLLVQTVKDNEDYKIRNAKLQKEIDKL